MNALGHCCLGHADDEQCKVIILFKDVMRKLLLAGDVYRRDSIDQSHYPVFHQMEGLCS